MRLLILTAALAALLGALPAAGLDVTRPEIKTFIDEVSTRDHFDRAWVSSLMVAAETRTSIIDAMTRPAEHVRPWHEYRNLFLTDKRIREGRDFIEQHRALLESATARTGVPGEMITAIVGIETSYGHTTGRYRVLDALATLAFDYPARASYFRGELEQFLLMTREAGVDPLKATGSYAGAMGAPQFMPRSYRSFARDGDGDGRIDLWNSWPDIIESVAHYFEANGWRRGEPVYATADLTFPDVEGLVGNRLELGETVASLAAKSVVFPSTLPGTTPAMFIALRIADSPTYRVGFHNFWVITRYNRSSMYALAAAELAAAIGPPSVPVASPIPVSGGSGVTPP